MDVVNLYWIVLILAQSVTFHFDCIVAEVKTEVHLFLMSSPKPDHNAEYTDSVIEIGDILRKTHALIRVRSKRHSRHSIPSIRKRSKYRSILGKGVRIRTPWSEMPAMKEEVVLKINQSVIVENGVNNVRVWFGPIEPDILYHIVCLSPEVTHFAYCEDKVNLTVPQQDYVFTNVPTGYYKIMIRRSSEPTFYVTAKFFVPEPPPRPTPPAGSESMDSFQILLIIGCALLAVCTTTTFYVLRKYGKLRYFDFIHNCVFFNSYQPTAQIQPNNNDNLPPGPADRKKVLMIWFPESAIFVEAVEALSAFITKWGDCEVVIDHNIGADNEQLIQKVNECCDGHMICIILSEHISMIYEILNHRENLPLDSDMQTQFIFDLLKKIHLEGRQKTVVSFFPVQLEHQLLKEEKVLTITEMAGTRAEACKANLKHIYQLFHKIHDNEFSIVEFQDSITTGNEQLTKLLESVRKLPRGLVTGSKLDNSNTPVTSSQEELIFCGTGNLLSDDFASEGNNNVAQKSFPKKLCDKHLNTLKWTEEQNRLKNGHAEIKWSPDPFSKNGVPPKVIYEPVKNSVCDVDLTCTCDRSCDDNDSVFLPVYSGLNEVGPKGNICYPGEKPAKQKTHRTLRNGDSHHRLKDGNSFCRAGKGLSVRGTKVFGGLREDSVFPATRLDNLLDKDGEFLPPDSDSDSDTQSMLFENINKRYIQNVQQQQISEL